jgi:cellulose synthase/poly-beta-1,6-N-acetylglucosamine synthase-like glycosyltransferase
MMITKGWFGIKTFDQEEKQQKTGVSLVVAMRNEEENILTLLDHLYKQEYPQDLIEIILVDDHSEDQTKHLVGKFRKETKVRNIILEKMPGKGKKAAIEQGIRLASGELIITTDADCVMGEKWISTIVSFYKKKQAKLISGPVVYDQEKGLFQKLFSADFAGLVATGAGSVRIGRPLMGNGANMAFERKAFGEISPQLPGKEHASGDDVFLIHKMSEHFGKEHIHFLKNKEVIVKTLPPQSIISFFSQRIRWASKAKAYRTLWNLMVPVLVAMFNLMITVSFIAGFYNNWFFTVFLFFVLTKSLVDLPLLKSFLDFSGKSKLLPYTFIFQLIYPFYIVLAAFLALFVRYEWKGRKGLR